MYESIKYEDILGRMLSQVPSNMDKREGSIIYDALAPCAIEMMLMYIELDTVLKETFGDTASREYLIRRALERGIEPSEATFAVLKGEFNMEVPIGSRFICDKIYYYVSEKIEGFSYKVVCETSGRVGNSNFGAMTPVGNINGLEKAELTELLIPGEDEEDTENLRERYLNSFSKKAFGGNVTDYLEKTNSIAGVGGTKVTPFWQGGGTVKLTILNSEYDKASYELTKFVQEEMDPKGEGTGIGIAPIGHIVTVDTVSDVKIDVSTSITFQSGYVYEDIAESVESVIEEYLLELRKDWVNEDNTVVRISNIDVRIMNITGVIDIMGTKINGSESNFELGRYEIPVVGVITNE